MVLIQFLVALIRWGVNKRSKTTKGQSRMDNPVTQAMLGI